MPPYPSWNNGGVFVGGNSPIDHQGDYGVDDDKRRSDLLKLILYDLNSTIAPVEHRIAALERALVEFDHDQDWRHDQELDLHADKILFQKLAFAYISNPSSNEVAMLCSGLEMVYRVSNSNNNSRQQRIASSFHELLLQNNNNNNDCVMLLPIFVEMLGKPLRYTKLEELEQAKKELKDVRQQQQELHQEQEAEAAAAKRKLQKQKQQCHLNFMSSSPTNMKSTATTCTDSSSSQGVMPPATGNFTTTTTTFSLHCRNDSVSSFSTNEEDDDDDNDPLRKDPPSPVQQQLNDHDDSCRRKDVDCDGEMDPSAIDTTASSITKSASSTAATENTSSISILSGDAPSSYSANDDNNNIKAMTKKIHLLQQELEMIRLNPSTHPIAIGRSLQVIRYFSRILSAMVPLAHFPGLLDSLIYQLERQPYGKYSNHFHYIEKQDQQQERQRKDNNDDKESSSAASLEPRSEFEKKELMGARLDAMAILVNLACAEENKSMMVSTERLLDSITCVAQNDTSEEVREYAAIVLMNLAYEDENKTKMVKHPQMLSTLVQLMEDKEKSPYTRQYASAAMLTLASSSSCDGNIEQMAYHGAILECLRRVLESDPVDETRINASEILFIMARTDSGAIATNSMGEDEPVLFVQERMGDHPQLLASLAQAVLTDYSVDVRMYCARTLEWMSADVHHPLSCHQALLSALTTSAQWTKTSCIAEALKTQAMLEENRVPMASHDGLLQALSNLAMLLDADDVLKASISALEMISREPKARIYMIQNEHVMQSLKNNYASFEEEKNVDHGLPTTTTTSTSYNNALNDEADDNDFGDGNSVTGQMIKATLKNLANKF